MKKVKQMEILWENWHRKNLSFYHKNAIVPLKFNLEIAQSGKIILIIHINISLISLV